MTEWGGRHWLRLPSSISSSQSFVLKNNDAMASSSLSSNWGPVTNYIVFWTVHIDCHLLCSYAGDTQVGGKK